MLRSSYIPLRAQASPSMVCMLPPFIVCKQEEEEAFYCFRELQRRMTRDLGDLPCSCVCVCVCESLCDASPEPCRLACVYASLAVI